MNAVSSQSFIPEDSIMIALIHTTAGFVANIHSETLKPGRDLSVGALRAANDGV